MAEVTQEKPKETIKAQGASFPSLSLPEAVKIIRDAGSYGKQHSLSALASYAGHTTADSGPFKQKLSSLRQWGFITTSNGTVTLTDAALGIAYPSNENDTTKILLGAFRGCRIFYKVYEQSAKGIPLKPELMANSAVTTYRVSISSKDRFVRSFIESAEAVGLLQRMPNGEFKLVQESSAKADAPQDNDATPRQGIDELVQPKADPPSAPRPGFRTILSQPWQDNDFEIIFEIRSSQQLPTSAFTQIGTTLEGIQKTWDALHSKQPEQVEQAEHNANGAMEER